MSEPLPVSTGAAPADAPLAPRSAGALLKAAREREGLHLAVLAATIKVSPAKLDALEKDRYAELPNLTFVRALAQSVCRSLKVDPRPVLALLPQQEAPPLESAVGKLNAPFQDRPSRTDGAGLAWASKPMFWAGGLLLLAAVLVALLPREWIENWRLPTAADAPSPATAAVALAPPAPASMAAAAAASEAAPTSPAAVTATLSAPVVEAASAPSIAVPPPAAVAVAAPPAQVAASAPAGSASAALQLAAQSPSWIEVLDANGNSLLSRVLQPGEGLGLDGRTPLRVRVGNASGTRVSWRGQPVDLAPSTRDNVARLELR